ncbi:MAG TPA: hypothetical protein VH853_11965 [Polyangia bacterium]|jgi:hypothetical protein|nr:hypothetical protein [Polyangia bacterium]
MRKSTYAFATAAAVAVTFSLSSVARAGDVEVVNPPATQAAPAAVPAAVVPVQEPAPVVVPPSQQRIIHEDVQPPHNVMTTITVSALMGGIAGLLVGGAIYYLADNQEHAGRIGIWAAGGVLVGTGVGIVQVAADESRANAAVSRLWSPDPAPTYRLALFRASF